MSKKKVFALLVTIFFLVIIFYKIDIHEVIETFKIFDFKNLWLIVILYMFSMPFSSGRHMIRSLST